MKTVNVTMSSGGTDNIDLKKIALYTMVIYFVIIIGLYYLAGDQFHIRDTRGKIEMLPPDGNTIELTQGQVVEQVFHAKIDRIDTVHVQWGAFNRVNSGMVKMEMLRQEDQELLMEVTYDASIIVDGQVLVLSTEEPIDGVYEKPLILRLTADSVSGSAASPLVCSSGNTEGFELLANGEPVQGMLCFMVDGTDYIWIGRHYWEVAAVIAAAIMLMFYVMWKRVQKGKHVFIYNAILALKKYRFLIRQLVERDFKTKYKRSILGAFWSFLNPLLMMLVQYFVFSTVFQSDIPNFAAYLIIGTVMFNFFSESCGLTLMSILGNASLITKVYMPKYIYPLTRTVSSVVNLLISLIPMMIVCIVTGVHLQKATILALYFFVCLIIFCLGLGILLATMMVFFRDVQFLWSVLVMMWMYATPIFYPETIIPTNLKFVLQVNPLYHFMKSVRLCIMNGLSPEPIVYGYCLLMALGMLLIGTVIFYKNQDKLILYL